MRRAPVLLATALAALSLGVAACGDDEDEPSTQTQATPEATEAAGGQIQSNPDNAKVTLKIGSKNFTEQQILGEIYAQGLAAAGYTTSTDLNLGDEQTAAEGRQGRPDQRLPRVHRHRAAVVLRQGRGRPAQGRPGGLRGGQGRVREGRPDGVPADAVHQLQRGRRDAGDGREVRPEQDLRPQQGRRPADALRHAGVPPADGLPGRPGRRLRAEVQEVHPRRRRAAPRGAAVRPRRRLDRVHDRPADHAQQGSPARGRQGHVPALQPVAA